MSAIVVGIGQEAAGDDGVGLAIARLLAARGLEVRESADASIVLALAEAGHRVVIVDAVVADGSAAPGTVLRLEPGQLASAPQPLSSHGLGVAEAVELARTLYGEAALAGLAIVAVVIDRPVTTAIGLSPVVAAAIEPAAALAASLAGAC